MKGMMNTEVSIVIVNYNTKDYVARCLKSIYNNKFHAKFEVIVIDNNSTDDSVAVLRQLFPRIRLVENKKNQGFAYANNQGTKAATGNYVLLLNPDTEVLPDALNVLYAFMNNHKDAAIAAPMLVDENRKRQASCRKFPGIWQEIVKAVGFPKYTPDHALLGYCDIRDWGKTQEVDQPQGACLMIRREVLSDGRVFDEDFYMYYEEVDLCYRVRKNGWRIYFVPAARVVHFSGKSFSQNMPRMIFHIYRSKFLFFRKHCDLTKQMFVYVLTLGEMVYRIAVYSVIGIVKRGENQELRFRIKGYRRVFRQFMMGNLDER